MKKIVFVALLAAAGCGSKKGGSDCDAAIAKAIENFSKSIKEHAPNPQIVDRMMSMMDKLKGVLTERCKADNWPPEVVSCFPTASNPRDMQACQSKLNPEQTSKLRADLAKVMPSAGMDMNRRMPPGMAGHPETLTGNTGSGAAAAPGTPPGPPGSSDTPAAPGTAAPPASPPAPPGTAAPAGSTAPPASGSAPK